MTSDTAPTPSPLDFVARHRALAAILAAAAVVRLTGIGDWWLNPDEGIYYSILTRADLGAFWAEVADNAHPPLYYLLLRGMAVLTWDFFWFRLFSVVCGVIAVAGAWAVAGRLAGRGEGGARRASVAGLVSGLLLAFSPGAVELSQVMRPYMMLLALLTWALFFLLRYLDDPRPRDLVAYTLLASLALLTHYGTVFALGVFGLLVLHDGVAGGTGRPEWRRLLAVHAVPGAILGLLYVFHLRALSGSTLADEALQGWLRFYMIDGPGDVWWSVLGFQRLVAPAWLQAPAALALVASVAIAAVTRDARVALVGGGALLFGIVAASLGVFPLGASRHSVWLMAFTVPVTGWFVAALLDVPWGVEARVRTGILALPILFGGPLGTLVGLPYTPWAAPDHVLRQEDLGDVIDLLDPSAMPELVVVSEQTFYLLMPFWAQERETAAFSADRTAFHFAWGSRRVLVSDAWDFTARTEGDAPGVHTADGVFAAHIGRFLQSAAMSFPDLMIGTQDEALLAVGGWRPVFVNQLHAMNEGVPLIRSSREVPGMHAFVVGLDPLAAALGMRSRPGLPAR